MYGDGSDGPLVVTGATNLALDTKHQFTTVDIQAGGTLRGVGDGAVLYISATESITVDGSILAHASSAGINGASVTIDGTLYTSPGVAPGGKGGDNAGAALALGGNQGGGFGGGGAGGSLASGWIEPWRGGHGGNGGTPAGSGGAARATSGGTGGSGNNGGVSAGGGGAAAGWGGNTGGKGGNAYGFSGGAGIYDTSVNMTGGGGGGGGRAGVPGVHIVLSSPSIYIGGSVSSRILDMSANGAAGGSGGASLEPVAFNPGSGGGGGGGANAGNLYLIGTELDHGSATINLSRGTGGPGGSGYQAGASGTNGTDGVLYATIIIPPQPYGGPFYRVWDGTEWQYVSGKVFNESVFKPSKPTIL